MFVRKFDLIDKYLRLDSTCRELDELPTSQFFKMYSTAHKKKIKKKRKQMTLTVMMKIQKIMKILKQMEMKSFIML